ncbi:hypothetical protein EZV62_007520 [Acer yangbiense]|uniref:Uncharacterized protein n=1 Tax=Acer yangbiense TaxID=1000413 RepID=A0A5C7IAI6_9ROSI|nr:hypothetical protein EZV62_007520 [Acer yangbiense]
MLQHSTQENNNAPTPNKCETEAAGNVGPAILFLAQHSTQEEWNNILATTKSGVALTGSAAMRQVRPIVGLVDILRIPTYFGCPFQE